MCQELGVQAGLIGFAEVQDHTNIKQEIGLMSEISTAVGSGDVLDVSSDTGLPYIFAPVNASLKLGLVSTGMEFFLEPYHQGLFFTTANGYSFQFVISENYAGLGLGRFLYNGVYGQINNGLFMNTGLLGSSNNNLIFAFPLAMQCSIISYLSIGGNTMT